MSDLSRSPAEHTPGCFFDHLLYGECFHNPKTGERLDPKTVALVPVEDT